METLAIFILFGFILAISLFGCFIIKDTIFKPIKISTDRELYEYGDTIQVKIVARKKLFKTPYKIEYRLKVGEHYLGVKNENLLDGHNDKLQNFINKNLFDGCSDCFRDQYLHTFSFPLPSFEKEDYYESSEKESIKKSLKYNDFIYWYFEVKLTSSDFKKVVTDSLKLNVFKHK